MHHQLSEKDEVCRQFIDALNVCHASGWRRLTGACNSEKEELVHCLRKAANERSKLNREAAKERRQRTEEAWKDLHKDD